MRLKNTHFGNINADSWFSSSKTFTELERSALSNHGIVQVRQQQHVETGQEIGQILVRLPPKKKEVGQRLEFCRARRDRADADHAGLAVQAVLGRWNGSITFVVN